MTHGVASVFSLQIIKVYKTGEYRHRNDELTRSLLNLIPSQYILLDFQLPSVRNRYKFSLKVNFVAPVDSVLKLSLTDCRALGGISPPFGKKSCPYYILY